MSSDSFLSPIDAVLVINALNSRPVAVPIPEGESLAAPDPPAPLSPAADDCLDSLVSLLASDIAQSTRRRRSR